MMRLLLYAAYVLVALDAAMTYYIITSGLGIEANPHLTFLNRAPEAVFLLQAFLTLTLKTSYDVVEALSAALRPAWRSRIHKVAYATLVASACARAAAVVNNVLGITIGITPLADALYA
jgi:predicted membrane channel-forming protein YqfA (hemolysin III family)